jgi:anti-sigma regulatory factor (Ser/Thr protein kinase)
LTPAVDPLEASPARMTLVDAPPAEIRHAVGVLAHEVLRPTTTSELLFALSEAVANAEEYGCPPVTTRAWTDRHRIVIHVHDTGFGPDDPLTGLVPALDGTDGARLGLWLSHQLRSIDIAMLTEGGFTVRLRAGSVPG